MTYTEPARVCLPALSFSERCSGGVCVGKRHGGHSGARRGGRAAHAGGDVVGGDCGGERARIRAHWALRRESAETERARRVRLRSVYEERGDFGGKSVGYTEQ